MIYFVIPLRSKAASRNWDNVTYVFNRTLESCYNQTCREFQRFVSCHEIPKLSMNYDNRVRFLPVNIPTPKDYDEMMYDKAYKMYACMRAVQEELTKLNGGGYVMPIDSDDLVSNRLAEFFKNKDDGMFYCSKYVYIWRTGSKFITTHIHPWGVCGSCTVVYYHPDELPNADYEHRDETRNYIFQNPHFNIPMYAKSLGKQAGEIPFPSTIYVIGTGDNHSVLSGGGVSWKRKMEGIIRIPRKINETIMNEFNIVI